MVLEQLFKPKFLEILKLLKDSPTQPSKLAKKVGFSESVFYEKVNILKELGLISEQPSINEQGRPIKLYSLTPLGLEILQKLEEIEELLKQHQKTGNEPVKWVKEEIEID